ncbi:penicillin acylase family protein [Actinoallomurus purpureus]|uniref:penicillin acylase family protein n=1 Tax=Actinoallomurus purpureus TaxID=478114 RepID=UPI0020930557|nr:penicillin acylase family protein [Actinoallomurus purpureus]MCO6009647.1 penicillin acylase family protein [Actinoallomurus purpureus]
MNPENTPARQRFAGLPGKTTGKAAQRRMTSALIALGMAAAAATTWALTSQPPSPEARLAGGTTTTGRYAVTIRRTEYGIPHIQAADYGGLGYGYGYAFAQDDLCVMADRVLTLRGERSQYFGPTAETSDTLVPPTTNLASDVYYQGIRRSDVVRRLLARPAPLGPTTQARRMVDGYVAGYNRYLRGTTAARLPDPTCRGKAWVTPITALDVWSGIYDIDQLNGATHLRQAIATATPPTAKGAATTSPSATPLRPASAARADTLGSNGWALGRDATRDHDGMLLANPHLPWNGDARLYQVQLTIPGTLNVSGVSWYGVPAVMLGHTDRLAWTHTVSHAQRFTLYQLALVPGRPTSYRVNGRTESMSRRTVKVTVRGSDGRPSTVTRTLYSSRYGPVIATGWTATTAFAVRDANAENLRSLNEWLAMDSSQDIAQLRTAQRTHQGLPFLYTMATDTSGKTYFADASVVPHVTDEEAKRCIDTPQGRTAYPGTFVLDGSTSTCGWGSDPDAIEPGIFGPGHDPTLSRTDYVTNSNMSPWLTNPKAPINGYPAVFGDSGTTRELRTRLSLKMISQRLEGTDGLGPRGFTLPTLQATMLGDRDYSAELGRTDVVKMCRAHPTLTATDGRRVDVRQACTTLAAWDAHTNLDSRGAVLWREFWVRAEDTADRWRVPFDPAHPLTTPREINGDAPGVRRALADAVQTFQNGRIPLSIALGSAQHYQSIPLHGCPDDEGCFNIVDPVGPPTTNGYPDNDHGSTFIMAVELTRRGPRSRTVLTYSESADPGSPHHTEQTVLFSHKRWVIERFADAEIKADPYLRTTTLHD